MRSHLLVAVALLLLPTTLYAADPSPRERLSLDRGWRFHLGDPAGVDPRQFDAVEIKPGTPVRADDFDGQVSSTKAKPDDFERDAELAKRRVDPVATNLGGSLPVVAADYDDRQWSPVLLPHDWAVALPFDEHGDLSHGFKRIGGPLGNDIGWYRRSFDLPAGDKGKLPGRPPSTASTATASSGSTAAASAATRQRVHRLRPMTSVAQPTTAGRNELVVRVDAGHARRAGATRGPASTATCG